MLMKERKVCFETSRKQVESENQMVKINQH